MIDNTKTPSTRDTILAAAFEEIHRQGFRSASLDNILRRTGVTKGALYHHFPNKTALGYAVVDEVIGPWADGLMAELNDETSDPIDTLLKIGYDSAQKDVYEDPMLGCPVNNLVQEMAPLDEGFRQRLHGIFEQWRVTIRDALLRGQRQGSVRAQVDADSAASFILAAYEGGIALAKSARDDQLFASCLKGGAYYMQSLRATDQSSSAVA